jgi:hypothetical protein
LIWQACMKIMTDQFRLWPVDDADGAFGKHV